MKLIEYLATVAKKNIKAKYIAFLKCSLFFAAHDTIV